MALVTIARFDSLGEATLARTLLSGADIYCHLTNEEIFAQNRNRYNALIEVQVPQPQAERAAELLRKYFEAGAKPRQVCPSCGSNNTESANGLFMYLLALLTLGLTARRSGSKCLDCGHSWK